MSLIVKARCPECKRQSVHYNGNYYCVNEECEWAMPDEDNTQEDYRIIKEALLQFISEAKADGDDRYLKRLEYYHKQLEKENEAGQYNG